MSDPKDAGTISVTVTCKKCGGTTMHHDENPTAETPVTCVSCGTDLGTWGFIMESARNAATEHVQTKIKGMLREATKGLKNIRFTG